MPGGDHSGDHQTVEKPQYLTIELRELQARLVRSTTTDSAVLLQLAQAGTPVRIVPGSELNGTRRPSVLIVPVGQRRAKPVRILRELLLTRQEREARSATPQRRQPHHITTALAEASDPDD